MKNSVMFSLAAFTLSLSSLTYAADAKKNAELAVLSASSKASITKVETELNKISSVSRTADYINTHNQAPYALSAACQIGGLLKETHKETLKSLDAILQKIDGLTTRVGTLETQVAALQNP